jgi:trehalose/maltose hydrolase-like predicted phosphorylase
VLLVGRTVPIASFDALPFSGDSWTLIADAEAATLKHAPALFVLGNGFIGLRGPGERADSPKVYLNGVFETVPITYHEAAHGYARTSDTRLAVADTTGFAISIDGTPLSGSGRLELNLRRGLLVQTIAHGDVEIKIERLVAMARTAVIATRISARSAGALVRVAIRAKVTPPPDDNAGDLADDASYDPRVGPGFQRSPWVDGEEVRGDGFVGRVDRLRQSGFAVAAIASATDIELEVGAAPAAVEIFAIYHAARDCETAELVARAADDMAAATASGFAALLAEQADWFSQFWEDAWISLPDAPLAERALRHGLFQLVQAAGRDGTTSIAAKGQSGEGYEGHVFWDAESYALPLFVYTRPEIARAMLAWRIGQLDAARANARAMGHKRGALYPWRTIAGSECSSFFPAGSAQYHINADIAYAIRLYVETTGDTSLLEQGGAELLAETARIWLQIGHHDPARGDIFVINSVTGPDEYSALVDNNLFTNMMAAEHLRFAVAVAGGFIDRDEAAAMRKAADAMALPFDEARGLYAQDERFFARQPWPFADTPSDEYPLLIHYHPLTIYRHQVCKQADAVLATVLLRDRFEPAMRARMLDAYEGVTVHDSTLSASAFATSAANIGDADRAYLYWRVSVLTDLANLFDNSSHGLHMAALAGGWTGMALGFGGMRTIDGTLTFAPIAVPALGRYAFRLRYRDRIVEFAVDGASAHYRLVEGKAVEMAHGDEHLILSPGVTIERPL